MEGGGFEGKVTEVEREVLDGGKFEEELELDTSVLVFLVGRGLVDTVVVECSLGAKQSFLDFLDFSLTFSTSGLLAFL